MEILTQSISDRKPGDFPALADLRPGDMLVADGGFTCLREGEVVTVEQDADGLFVYCCAHDDGEYGKPVNDTRYERHYLDGQAGDHDECVGLFRFDEGGCAGGIVHKSEPCPKCGATDEDRCPCEPTN